MSYPNYIIHKETGSVFKYAGYEELYDYHNNISWGVYNCIYSKNKDLIGSSEMITDHYNYNELDEETVKTLYSKRK